jgi:DNA-binding transcriptional regulator GbsR (MarR family)
MFYDLRMSAADESRRVFVERMGGALTSAGLARLPSRIFAALLADPDGRMTAAEIGTELRVSPASVSGAVRYLDGVGMIRREREPGSRKDVFVVDDDAWRDTLLHADRVYAPMIAELDRALDALPADDPARRRIAISREFMGFVTEEMGSMSQRWQVRLAELDL